MQFRRFLGNFAKTFLAVGALSVSAFAGADDFHNYGSNNGYINHDFHNNCGTSTCAPSCAPSCAPTSCCGTPCNAAPECAWGYNPPAYSRCGCDTSCGNGFLDSFAFRADFLWWRACEEGLELGREEFVDSFTSGGPQNDSVINRSHSKKPNFKYDPGFRIGFANYCACDCWDFAVNWTHYHTKAKVNGASDEANDIFFVSDWERVSGANPTRSQGRYSLKLDLVDIEFGRKFYVSSCFVLRPQFGLRIARIHQNYSVASASNLDRESDPLSDFVSDVRARSNFSSVGPRVGVDIELHLGCGVTLFGCAAGSVMFGKIDNHSREDFTNFSANGNDVGSFEYSANSSAHRCSRTITDLAFGFKWDSCYEWCNRSHPVSLAFAWEHHAFYDMNNFNFVARGYDFDERGNGNGNGNRDAGLVGGNHTRHGDLYTQGLTVSLSFGF
ncbi:MAG TPA: Lpg1974 family pore-forming outer membrane protein [Parachlamydiaceae bacterium]|nr:Lpg1974 family pore-forming outer membrane protein [Parachlamydiaceae bacterium]